MTRRMSEKEKRERADARADKKAEEDGAETTSPETSAPAETGQETGGGAGVDETSPEMTAETTSPAGELEDLEDENGEEIPASVPVPKKGFFAPPDAHASPIPNKPSFDWIEKDGEKVPNLGAGEEVVGEFEKDGLRYVRTTGTRFIYLATAAEYEKVHGLLPLRQVYIESFPHAFPKKVRPKG